MNDPVPGQVHPQLAGAAHGGPDPAVPARIHWTENGRDHSAPWRSERSAPAPTQVVLADDTTSADAAYRLACAGTALLWRGDFHNARQLLQAMARRIDQPPARKRRGATQREAPPDTGAANFHRHRQAQAQRARILGMVLLQVEVDYAIALRRAPDMHLACTEAWGAAASQGDGSVVSLRELMGVASAHEWRIRGVEVPALGVGPNNRIHPHYGVFSPARGEYIALVAQTPLPVTGQQPYVAFDIGTGSGVLAAVLARRGLAHIVATDLEPRALACARDNLQRLGLQDQVELHQTDLFPSGQASLIVCNPPWLPARPTAPIEHAVYDEGGRMLQRWLAGVAEHLAPDGEAWLVLSDLAEHLGLRSRDALLAAITQASLVVAGRVDTRPHHPKAGDQRDRLHQARSAEITSLWRLVAASANVRTLGVSDASG
ncbi:MAG: class I SAM-dependent methyltransferase [Burkholderiaceae bacterium]